MKPVDRGAPLRPDAAYIEAQKKWIGKEVRVFLRDQRFNLVGPFDGVVKGLSDNSVVSEDEGKLQYEATGLLVDIPELGPEQIFRQWPVLFKDAELKS